jgi:hypothetical protein
MDRLAWRRTADAVVTFALCYIAGAALIVCVAFIVLAGALLFYVVYKYNVKYGEHGLMKEMAARVTPKRIVCDQLFQNEKPF